jgi:hypothetical protein
MKDDYVSLKLTPIDKEMINSAMIKGKILIDAIQQEDTSVFVDYLKELQSIFESAMNKINKKATPMKKVICVYNVGH